MDFASKILRFTRMWIAGNACLQYSGKKSLAFFAGLFFCESDNKLLGRDGGRGAII